MPHREEFRILGERAVEAVRSAALGAAPDGIRSFVIGEAERDAVHAALEADGLAIAAAKDAATLVERACGAAPPDAAGPTALARLAHAALADGSVRVLVLENAGRADSVSAKFWWTLAVLLSEDDAPDGVLLATCGPRAGESWISAAWSVRGYVPVRELAIAVTSGSPSAGKRNADPARTVHARRALLRATAALLRGRPRDVEAAAESAARASARADDAREAAAASLALALRDFPTERTLSFQRAIALARLAGDDVLAGAATTAARVASLLGGELAAARSVVAATALPRSVKTVLRDLDAGDRDAETFAARAEAHERAGRRAVAARLHACAAAARGEPFGGPTWDRARALWEIADPRLAAAAAAAAAPGLGGNTLPAGAAGIAEALRASASFVALGSAAPGAALELACQLVPCRSAILSGSDGTVLAARGAAALSLGRLHGDAGRLGSAPQELAAGTGLRVLFARATEDPPFSRDERRLAAALVELAAAVLQPRSRLAVVASAATLHEPAPVAEAAAPPAARRKRRGSALPPLDDRLSEVERDVLVEALRRTGGNLSRTARTLGLSRNGLKMKLARHGLPRGTTA